MALNIPNRSPERRTRREMIGASVVAGLGIATGWGAHSLLSGDTQDAVADSPAEKAFAHCEAELTELENTLAEIEEQDIQFGKGEILQSVNTKAHFIGSHLRLLLGERVRANEKILLNRNLPPPMQTYELWHLHELSALAEQPFGRKRLQALLERAQRVVGTSFERTQELMGRPPDHRIEPPEQEPPQKEEDPVNHEDMKDRSPSGELFT